MSILYQSALPARVRLLILGGGIHGVGLLHDMASRGWRDIHLIDKSCIGSGTSSRSTKLIHGGLRYLEHITDFPLVFQALHERATLKQVASDLVSDLKIFFPLLKNFGLHPLKLQAGLSLYDLLAGKHKERKHERVRLENFAQQIPHFKNELLRAVFSYWDMQTDDLKLVHRIAESGVNLGGKITEGCAATKITPSDDGWIVDIKTSSGQTQKISALYVYNALGPWANTLLNASDLTPTVQAVNSKGAHIILPNFGLTSGLFLQSHEDRRMFFVLPWQGYCLVGTTETLFKDNPDRLSIEQQDVDYLLRNFNFYFTLNYQPKDVLGYFAGLRWLALKPGKNLGETSRSDILTRTNHKRGIIFTLYGGKLTTYRYLSEKLGNEITQHFGEFVPSKTKSPASWVSANAMSRQQAMDFDPLGRFAKGGVAFSPQHFK